MLRWEEEILQVTVLGTLIFYSHILFLERRSFLAPLDHMLVQLQLEVAAADSNDGGTNLHYTQAVLGSIIAS